MELTSLKKSILFNVSAFLFVFILEILSGLLSLDSFDSVYDFLLWELSYTFMIMFVVWVNHLVLIPLLFDKKRYITYVILLLVLIFFGTQLKAFGESVSYFYKLYFFLLYTTAAGMAFFFLRRSIIFKKQNIEKEKLQKEMELNYLKEQVNPHFLFNSLNSIYSLSKIQSPETPELVIQLSELMRYQLESAKKNVVFLTEEIEFIENYLLLEEKRLSGRCLIELEVVSLSNEFTIAPMLLIPFVENAIKHGAQSTNNQSFIQVSATVKNDVFVFSILNSKPITVVQTNRKGLGLDNVTKRLQLLYPNTHKLKILNTSTTYTINLSIELNTLKTN